LIVVSLGKGLFSLELQYYVPLHLYCLVFLLKISNVILLLSRRQQNHFTSLSLLPNAELPARIGNASNVNHVTSFSPESW